MEWPGTAVVTKGLKGPHRKRDIKRHFMRTLPLMACLLGCSQASGAEAAEDQDKMVGCFWNVQGGFPKLKSTNVDTSLCSHIIYGHGTLDTMDWALTHGNKTLDLELGGFRNVSRMKHEQAGLRVELGVEAGGREASGLGFKTSQALIQMAADQAKRKSFVNSSVAFLTQHRLDGLHLHWGSSAQKVINFTQKGESWMDLPTLLRELKKAFRPANLSLSLSLWSPLNYVIDDHYDIPELYKHVDLVFVQFFAYHGPWERITGAFSPLKDTVSQVNDYKYYTVDFSWTYMKKRGAVPCKTVFKIAFKGAEFALKDRIENTEDSSVPGQGLRTVSGGGNPTYHQICKEAREEGWRQEWDEERRVPYMWRGRRWISYEDRRSVLDKVDYANREGMAGVAVNDLWWECYNTGYPAEPYHPTNISYPLLRTIYHRQGGRCGAVSQAIIGAGQEGTGTWLTLALVLFAKI